MNEEKEKELKKQVELFHKASLEFINKTFKESNSSFLRGFRFVLKDDKWMKKS